MCSRYTNKTHRKNEMTVKCVNEEVKDSLVHDYLHNKLLFPTTKLLADCYIMSPRTVNRILAERGLKTPEQRIKGEAWNVMALLKLRKIENAKELAQILDRVSDLSSFKTPVQETQSQLNKSTPAQLASYFYTATVHQISVAKATAINDAKQTTTA